MYMRLALQASAAGLSRDLYDRLPTYIRSHLPTQQHPYVPRPGRLSPLDSRVGPAVIELLFELHYPDSAPNWKVSIETLRNAVDVAIEDKSIGGDEVLYGRAGLLWAMLALRKMVANERQGDVVNQAIQEVVNDESTRRMVEAIMTAGRELLLGPSKDEYHAMLGTRSGEGEVSPLLWPWHGELYLGA